MQTVKHALHLNARGLALKQIDFAVVGNGLPVLTLFLHRHLVPGRQPFLRRVAGNAKRLEQRVNVSGFLRGRLALVHHADGHIHPPVDQLMEERGRACLGVQEDGNTVGVVLSTRGAAFGNSLEQRQTGLKLLEHFRRDVKRQLFCYFRWNKRRCFFNCSKILICKSNKCTMSKFANIAEINLRIILSAVIFLSKSFNAQINHEVFRLFSAFKTDYSTSQRRFAARHFGDIEFFAAVLLQQLAHRRRDNLVVKVLHAFAADL